MHVMSVGIIRMVNICPCNDIYICVSFIQMAITHEAKSMYDNTASALVLVLIGPPAIKNTLTIKEGHAYLKNVTKN